MKDKAFVDSNVWLYLLGNDQVKKEKALTLLQGSPIIGTQVLAENSNVCRRKFGLDIETTAQHLLNKSTALPTSPSFLPNLLSLHSPCPFC